MDDEILFHRDFSTKYFRICMKVNRSCKERTAQVPHTPHHYYTRAKIEYEYMVSDLPSLRPSRTASATSFHSVGRRPTTSTWALTTSIMLTVSRSPPPLSPTDFCNNLSLRNASRGRENIFVFEKYLNYGIL